MIDICSNKTCKVLMIKALISPPYDVGSDYPNAYIDSTRHICDCDECTQNYMTIIIYWDKNYSSLEAFRINVHKAKYLYDKYTFR